VPPFDKICEIIIAQKKKKDKNYLKFTKKGKY
jgi:hypothetical protein